MPRLSTIERNAINLPAEGLIVYDTNTASFWYFNGGNWQELVQAAGLDHPSQIGTEHIMRRVGDTDVRPLSQLIVHLKPGALLGNNAKLEGVWRDYWHRASASSFALQPGAESRSSGEGRRKAVAVVVDEAQAPLL